MVKCIIKFSFFIIREIDSYIIDTCQMCLGLLFYIACC